MLKGKNIVLGVTGSIAAYKAADLASKLSQAGAILSVVMTKGAQEFVTPLTFRSITHRPVATEMFDITSEFSVEHVALGEQADLVVIAPATANTIAKLAMGIADDILPLTVLATKAPVILAPAMETNMYQNPATQDNLARLKERGFDIVSPSYGHLASGKEGLGRLVDIDEILGTIRLVLGRGGDMAGRRIVVSAGGTQEPFDPIRHIGNRSSGKMGYAVAEAARDRGAKVVLVSAPTALPDPVGVEVIHVRTAIQMRDAVLDAARDADVLVMTAAVADYRPVATSEQKIKKDRADTLTLELIRNPDILSEVKGDIIKVGFAAETAEKFMEHGKEELEKKGLDLVCANDITALDSGFGADTNKVVIIGRSGEVESLSLMLKIDVAHKILDRVVELLPKI